jgi:hypothetical protein
MRAPGHYYPHAGVGTPLSPGWLPSRDGIIEVRDVPTPGDDDAYGEGKFPNDRELDT